MASHSTPVQNLPKPAGQPPEDPVVRDVLKEMEAEMAAAGAGGGHGGPGAQAPHPHPHPPAAPMPPPAHPHAAAPLPPYPSYGAAASASSSVFFDFELAKRALAAAAIAALIFHPMVADMMERRVPALSMNESYMVVARILLLAVVLYALMWKFNL